MRIAFCLIILQVTRLIRTVSIQMEEATTSEAGRAAVLFLMNTKGNRPALHYTGSYCRSYDRPPSDKWEYAQKWADPTHPKNGVSSKLSRPTEEGTKLERSSRERGKPQTDGAGEGKHNFVQTHLRTNHLNFEQIKINVPQF